MKERKEGGRGRVGRERGGNKRGGDGMMKRRLDWRKRVGWDDRGKNYTFFELENN